MSAARAKAPLPSRSRIKALPARPGNKSVPLPADLYEALRVTAEKYHRSIAGQLRFIVSEACKADLRRSR